MKRTSRAGPSLPALRDDQLQRTRERILDALVRTMANGIAELSVPAVAREAKLSVPTIYRHFRTKAQLLAALPDHLNRKTRLIDLDPTWDLAETVRQIYQRYEGLEDVARAALASEVGGLLRKRTMPQRVRRLRALVDAQHPKLPAADAQRLTRVFLILTSSAMMRGFRDYLDLPSAAASEDVAWAVTMIERGLKRAGGAR